MNRQPLPPTPSPPRSGRGRRGPLVGVVALLAVAVPLFAKVKIEHDPVKKATSGQRIEIEAQVKDKASGIREARAYFKSGHDDRFWFAPMRPDGNNHVAILPAPALGAETVEYRIYAVNGAQEFVKTPLYSIRVEDDEEALARMEAKEPTNVEIDLDQIEQMRDLAQEAGEPDPSRQVEVRNDVPGSEMPSQIPGFQDYIVMAEAPPAAAGAGLAGASVVSASGGGLGAGAITAITLGGLAGAAVAVEAADTVDDSDDHGGGEGSGATQQSVTLRNSGRNNIHICAECTGSDFNRGNRIAPGDSRTIQIGIPAGQQSTAVRFSAGRNRRVLANATCTVSRSGRLSVVFRETCCDQSLSCE